MTQRSYDMLFSSLPCFPSGTERSSTREGRAAGLEVWAAATHRTHGARVTGFVTSTGRSSCSHLRQRGGHMVPVHKAQELGVFRPQNASSACVRTSESPPPHTRTNGSAGHERYLVLGSLGPLVWLHCMLSTHMRVFHSFASGVVAVNNVNELLRAALLARSLSTSTLSCVSCRALCSRTFIPIDASASFMRAMPVPPCVHSNA